LAAVAVASGLLFASLSAQAQLVDFSSYSAGTVLGSGSSTDGVNPPAAQGTLTDSEGAGTFSYRGTANSFATQGITTTYSIDIHGSGPAGNYLGLSSTKSTGVGGGNPTSFVYSTSAHATTETQVWTMDFSAQKLANPSGEVFMALMSASAYNNGYTLDQISASQTPGANLSTTAMVVRFNSQGTLNLYRTGADNILEAYNGTTWSDGLQSAGTINWNSGYSGNYRVVLSVDGTTGAMNATLKTLDENLSVTGTVLDVDYNVSDVGSQGTNGGFRFVAGDIGTNTIFGYDMSIYSLSLGDAIPEPSTYAAIAGIAVLGLALLRRRLQRRTA
jgi:hypothetical protein